MIDLLNWLARFHPALVHLPLGMLIAGTIFHWWSLKKPTWKGASLVPVLYLLGFASGLVAAFAGWLLAGEGGYREDTIFWHRWLGIGMVLISFFLWRRTSNDVKGLKATRWTSLALIAGLLWTGHLGGKMTHGEDYLIESAPAFIQKIASYEEGVHFPEFQDPDSARVYQDLIQPFLREKCWSCHNNSITKGGLNMEDDTAFFDGGKNGKVIEGNAATSELFKRVTMEPGSKKFMPPKGNSLSYNEVKLLEWWLDGGAPTSVSVSAFETPAAIQSILLARHKLDTKPKMYIEKVKVDAATEESLQKLRMRGFSVKEVAMDNHFLDVKWKQIDTLSINEEISLLEQVAPQVAWLDVSNSELSDEAMAVIGKLPNLVRLKADNNPITDTGIKSLTELMHLESLNLYNTKISDLCASDLAQLKSLKKLFIWQTSFGDPGITQLKGVLPKVEVVGGYSLTETETLAKTGE